MQVRDLISELQRFEPTQKVFVETYVAGSGSGCDTEFNEVEAVKRESLPVNGSCVSLVINQTEP